MHWHDYHAILQTKSKYILSNIKSRQRVFLTPFRWDKVSSRKVRVDEGAETGSSSRWWWWSNWNWLKLQVCGKCNGGISWGWKLSLKQTFYYSFSRNLNWLSVGNDKLFNCCYYIYILSNWKNLWKIIVAFILIYVKFFTLNIYLII